jgi:hypothetical protein
MDRASLTAVAISTPDPEALAGPLAGPQAAPSRSAGPRDWLTLQQPTAAALAALAVLAGKRTAAWLRLAAIADPAGRLADAAGPLTLDRIAGTLGEPRRSAQRTLQYLALQGLMLDQTRRGARTLWALRWPSHVSEAGIFPPPEPLPDPESAAAASRRMHAQTRANSGATAPTTSAKTGATRGTDPRHNWRTSTAFHALPDVSPAETSAKTGAGLAPESPPYPPVNTSATPSPTNTAPGARLDDDGALTESGGMKNNPDRDPANVPPALAHALRAVGFTDAGPLALARAVQAHGSAALAQALRLAELTAAVDPIARAAGIGTGQVLAYAAAGHRPQGPANVAAAVLIASAPGWTAGERDDGRDPRPYWRQRREMLAAIRSAAGETIAPHIAGRLAWLFSSDYIAANVARWRKDGKGTAGIGLCITYLQRNAAGFDEAAAWEAAHRRHLAAHAKQAERQAAAAAALAEAARAETERRTLADALAAATDEQIAAAVESVTARDHFARLELAYRAKHAGGALRAALAGARALPAILAEIDSQAQAGPRFVADADADALTSQNGDQHA